MGCVPIYSFLHIYLYCIKFIKYSCRLVDKLLRIYGGSAKNYLNIDLAQLPIYYYLLLELVEYFLLLSCPLLNIYFQRFPDIILFTYFTRRSLSQSSYEINSFPSLSSPSQSSYEINSSLLERR